MTLIRGAEGIFTGLPGEAMRAKGAIRIADGRITEIGALTPRPDEALIDASGYRFDPARAIRGRRSAHQCSPVFLSR
jgi:cytosine/adenosine deaminase-related metal-dependent hydrolase